MQSDSVIRRPASGWFSEARFGMFVHWGLYSIWGRDAWVMFKERIPRKEYNRLADRFRPRHFDAAAWAALARQAGARYVVLTTRHHDGFCLFDSRASDFTSVKTAARRDFVAEYVRACRTAGLKIGFYYSLMNWQQPASIVGPVADPNGWAAMVAQSHAQVRELMSHYGRIDLLWYDGAFVPGTGDNALVVRYWRSRELNALVRRLQPHILINDRSGLPEDFSTPEQHVTPPPAGRLWEACLTINQSWGYHATDKDFKSTIELLECLGRCARFGGNLLLNVGPRADGTVQPEFVKRLREMGAWLAGNGAAIYGTTRSAFTEAERVAGPVTQKGRHLYVHLFQTVGNRVRLDAVPRIKRATVLGTSQFSARVPPSGGPDKGQALTGATATNDPPEGGTLAAIVHRRGAAADLAGFSAPLTRGLPVVLDVELDGAGPGRPARLLRNDHHDDPQSLPRPPLLNVAKLARPPFAASDGAAWCPGWHGARVLSPRRGDGLELRLAVPVVGRYDLELGLVARQSGRLTVRLQNQTLAGPRRLRSPSCPDTSVYRRLRLRAGQHRLVIEGGAPFGVYALRLTPCWRALATECWGTIGPFPTGFGPQQPVAAARRALRRVFPPERGFVSAAEYGLLRWQYTRRRQGDHAACGVDFPHRCGVRASAVCYAWTCLVSPAAREADLLLGCDWWANVWVNGRPVRSARAAAVCRADGAQFNAWKPIPARIWLRRGANEILVKCHGGIGANWFTCWISDPGDLKLSAAPTPGKGLSLVQMPKRGASGIRIH